MLNRFNIHTSFLLNQIKSDLKKLMQKKKNFRYMV